MRPAEMALACETCGLPADYYDSVPDAGVQGLTPAEAGYRLKPLCWLCAVARSIVTTSRLDLVLRCESQGIARVDGGRAGGDCVCPACGKKFYDHPRDADHPYMTVLCDGTAVKL